LGWREDRAGLEVGPRLRFGGREDGGCSAAGPGGTRPLFPIWMLAHCEGGRERVYPSVFSQGFGGGRATKEL